MAERDSAARESPPARGGLQPEERLSALEQRLDALEQRVADADQKVAWDIRGGLDWLRRHLMREIDRTRSRLAVSDSDVLDLVAYRQTADYAALFDNPRPLVTVTISTYNRAELVVARSLASVIRQDYDNLEVIIVDDDSTDDTERRVRALGDPRVIFTRMAGRVLPPEVSAGVEALNLGLAMATGDFITHLDDDDEYEPDRISKLIRFVQTERIEFVWHPFRWQETEDQGWQVNEAQEMELSSATTGSVLYMGWLKRFMWDPLAGLRYAQPDDWTLFRTLRDLGVVMQRYPETLLRHYKEGQNPRWAEGSASTRPDA